MCMPVAPMPQGRHSSALQPCEIAVALQWPDFPAVTEWQIMDADSEVGKSAHTYFERLQATALPYSLLPWPPALWKRQRSPRRLRPKSRPRRSRQRA